MFPIVARSRYPHPWRLERKSPIVATQGLNKPFWLYVAAVACLAAGFADFPLIAYRCKKHAIARDAIIPIFYAMAMGVDALAALLFGRLFDRIGIRAMVIAVFFSSFFAPLVFLGNFWMVMGGMALWGIGMGAQESIMRAAIADMVPSVRRGSAYGIFNTGYGLFWF
ncbi:MAG: MFS transporter [Candidatus Omnitrophota bacterium]